MSARLAEQVAVLEAAVAAGDAQIAAMAGIVREAYRREHMLHWLPEALREVRPPLTVLRGGGR